MLEHFQSHLSGFGLPNSAVGHLYNLVRYYAKVGLKSPRMIPLSTPSCHLRRNNMCKEYTCLRYEMIVLKVIILGMHPV